jgi:Ca2+-dependent lipid-binding protein
VTLSEIQGFDLPKADRYGLADPYVMLMWESVNFEVPNMTFAHKVRRYYNRYYWLRTNHVSRSLNPHWKEERIVIEAENPTIPNGALLHLMVVDYDAVGKDDFMCSTSFNVSELIPATAQSGKRTLDIDRPLIQEGRVSGRIKLKLDVEISRRGSDRGRLSLFAPSRFLPFLDTSKPSKTGSRLVDDNVESEQLPVPSPPEFQYSKTL